MLLTNGPPDSISQSVGWHMDTKDVWAALRTLQAPTLEILPLSAHPNKLCERKKSRTWGWGREPLKEIWSESLRVCACARVCLYYNCLNWEWVGCKIEKHDVNIYSFPPSDHELISHLHGLVHLHKQWQERMPSSTTTYFSCLVNLEVEREARGGDRETEKERGKQRHTKRRRARSGAVSRIHDTSSLKL